MGEIRAALDTGAASLCGCPQGQWWLSSIYAEYGSMLDRNGVEMGNPSFRQTRGVPPGMIHGADAVTWLDKSFVGATAATAKMQSSLGASVSLTLAGLIGAVPASLQSATWHGPSFSPVGQAPGLFAAILLAGAIAVVIGARLRLAMHRIVERLSAVDDLRERQAD